MSKSYKNQQKEVKYHGFKELFDRGTAYRDSDK